MRSLHKQLTAVGLPVTGKEAGRNPTFGPTTKATVKAFQQRFHLPVTGKADAVTTAVLTLAQTVTSEQDPAALQKKIKKAATASTSPAYSYWIARYALMSGDYATALTAAHLVPNFGDLLGGELVGAIDPNWRPLHPQPLPPDLPHPENFYSYRGNLIDPDVLAGLQFDLASLTTQQYAAYLTAHANPTDPATIDPAWFAASVATARKALACLAAWQNANHHAADRELKLAMQAYAQCQVLAADYFTAVGFALAGNTAVQRLQSYLAQARQNEDQFARLWGSLRWRRILLTLGELDQQDHGRITSVAGAFDSASAFVANFTGRDEFGTNAAAVNAAERLEPFLIVLGTILVPFAMAEANSQLRQFDAAIAGLTDVLTQQAGVDAQFRYICEFIEVPFVRLLILEALRDRADAEYKAGTLVDDSAFPDAATYHDLLAAQTYEEMLTRISEDSTDYTMNLAAGKGALIDSISSALQANDTRSLGFRTLGKQITVPTIIAVSAVVPGLDVAVGPHHSIATIVPPGGQAIRATNPRLYALGLLATAKLEQIKAGFNYLGYPADYVPPWRFAYLLDRARYFTEHAKNAERDYLNFLSNAEHEEFQERSTAQSVDLEKSNVNLETAKVDLAGAKLAAAQSAADAAALQAQDAHARASEYVDWEMEADDAEAWQTLGTMFKSEASIAEGIMLENPADVIQGVFGLIGAVKSDQVGRAQRALERRTLARSAGEADAAAATALKNVAVEQASLVVAGLERQAAILRHECAVENLNYVRNRTLNADLWFRLANAMRSVSEIYLHRAIELAFLAQQAYNFELDKRLSVIRFDYDQSEVGAMLAGDFLFRDLDFLEQDLLTSKQSRQQPVRYVLSLAREFPATLNILAVSGQTMFSLRLEQLERHFPGLLGIRISSVELQPTALMDPARVTVELTHLGSGTVRLKGQPGNSPLNTTDLAPDGDWLSGVGTDWPVKIHLSGLETALFSGLSRQEAASASGIAANERAAFEGRPGASSWRIDMSMEENQVVPGTLADVVLTFNLSGYYDPDLRALVGQAEPTRLATTSFISARRTFPDAYYSLVHAGTLDWDISERMLSLTGTPNALRNLGVLLPIASDGRELGRCCCRYRIVVAVTPGTANVVTALPEFTLTPNGLNLGCAYTGPAATQVTWDFGDGTALFSGPATQHTYARPGGYEVFVRLARAGRLAEYRCAVVISGVHQVVAPLIVAPLLSAGPASADGTIPVSFALPAAAGNVALECASGGARAAAAGGPVTLALRPGTHTVDLLMTRQLSARFYSRQRYAPTTVVALGRGRVATNRPADGDPMVPPNSFATQVFGDWNAAISPVDRWTLEVSAEENPWFVKVSPSDIAEFDGSELSDAVLSLEFETI